ncbi:MAG: saccharopine dehydrogenase C-terminal domain-containing protein [Actinomycetota bacterium]
MRTFDRVLVAGLGKVGELVARLLHGSGYEVVGADLAPPRRDDLPFRVVALDVSDPAGLRARLATVDAVVCCLPYQLSGDVARAAAATSTHYFDLTEDVLNTGLVRDLAEGAPSAFVPHCGLAPGLICMTGAWLADGFDEPSSMELKVGALPRHPTGLLGYAFNWSPEGVVNEYLNDCEVIRQGSRRQVPSMSELEVVWIAGAQLEAFTTSGGLGTMCSTYEGRLDRLDYKTLRYPGHCQLMRFFFDELHLRNQRELAGRILVEAKPPVDDDVVYLYAAVEGRRDGRLVRDQVVRAYEPICIDGRRWRAISWTTAASACAVVELVATGRLPARGFVRQEDVAAADFAATPTGRLLGNTATEEVAA